MAAIILASSTLLSAILGIFRDRWLNGMYLDTYPAGISAYTAAFTVPDFLYFLITSGALAVTFIPVFNERVVKKDTKGAWELSTCVLNFMALVSLVASILIMIFADPLIRYVVAPGLNESAMTLCINMMRVIAINPFLFSISTVISSMQQAVGRFVFYAMAPALYNVGIIVGILSFTSGINIFGVQIFEGGIMGVAIGVVFGAVLQLLTSVVGLIGLGFDYRFKIDWKNKSFLRVLKLLPVRSVDQALDYVMNMANTNLASRMGEQSIRVFQQASSLHSMPVSLIGVAISSAFFPKLSEQSERGEEQKLQNTFRSALRTIIWISAPVSIIAFFARGYVVNFVKNGGNPKIASVLGAFVVAIFCHSVFHIASRIFYAQQNTKTPLIISVATFLLQFVAAIIFTMLGFGPEGLAYAVSISALAEVGILLIAQNIHMKGKLFDKKFRLAMWKIVFASIAAGAVSYIMTKILPLRSGDNSFISTMPKFCAISVVSIVVYVVICSLLRLEEVEPVINKTKQILFTPFGPQNKKTKK